MLSLVCRPITSGSTPWRDLTRVLSLPSIKHPETDTSRRNSHLCRLHRRRALYQRAILTAYCCLFRTSPLKLLFKSSYSYGSRLRDSWNFHNSLFCFRLEFLMGEHVLPRDITVYQAVQQFGGQVRPTPPPLPPPPGPSPEYISEHDKNCDRYRIHRQSCGSPSL